MEFLASAKALGIVVDTPDGSDSYVQLCILAGIAAADGNDIGFCDPHRPRDARSKRSRIASAKPSPAG